MFWTVWTALAHGGVPVVYDEGELARHIAHVSKRTGLPSDQLEGVGLQDLLREKPSAAGDAVLRRCTRQPVTPSAVAANVARAEAAWAQDSQSAARDQLDLAIAELGCLNAPVDRTVAARAFLLRAAISLTVEDETTARSELRTALGFKQDVVWTAGYPVIGAAMLEEERTAPSIEISTAPHKAPSGPWIDGEALSRPVQRADGLHLVQYSGATGIESGWLAVGGPATVVVPTNFRRPILNRMAEPAIQADLAALMSATLPDFEAGYVAYRGGLWLVAGEPGAWTIEQLSEPEPEPEPEPETKGKKGKKR
jgi:hypothetical protein